MSDQNNVSTPATTSQPAPAQQRPTSAPKVQRSSRRALCWLVVIAVALASAYWIGTPYVAAAMDPGNRARVSVEHVRKAERTVAERLAAIKKRYDGQHGGGLKAVIQSVDEFHDTAKALRDMGHWLLQERHRIEGDMDAYVAAMDTAIERLQAAAEHYDRIAVAYPEDSEFRDHYIDLIVEYVDTMDHLKTQVKRIRQQQQQLDQNMEYIKEVLIFLDRFEQVIEILSIRNSPEAQQVERYLATLNSFRSRFKEMMQLLKADPAPAT